MNEFIPTENTQSQIELILLNNLFATGKKYSDDSKLILTVANDILKVRKRAYEENEHVNPGALIELPSSVALKMKCPVWDGNDNWSGWESYILLRRHSPKSQDVSKSDLNKSNIVAGINYLYNLEENAVWAERLFSADKKKGNARKIFYESMKFVQKKGVKQIYQRALPTAPIAEYEKAGFRRMESSEVDIFYNNKIFPQIIRRDDRIHMCLYDKRH